MNNKQRLERLEAKYAAEPTPQTGFDDRATIDAAMTAWMAGMSEALTKGLPRPPFPQLSLPPVTPAQRAAAKQAVAEERAAIDRLIAAHSEQ